MSSTTKPFEEKMNASVNHLIHELASIRAGRANPAILEAVAQTGAFNRNMVKANTTTVLNPFLFIVYCF